MKLTCLTNIYNEEYLLPFWLQHHKTIFDHGIIVNYASTDKSIEICKKICPDWTIIDSRNQDFDAHEIDIEFMDLEKDIEGFKIVLNTTEFLFSKTSIKEFLQKNYADQTNIAIRLTCFSPYSNTIYEPKNLYELFYNMKNDDIKFQNDRGFRFLHNHIHGNYSVGRHSTCMTPVLDTNEIFIIWLGFYPLNEKLLNRKLQIKNRMSQRDIINGYGFHHKWSKDEMLNICNTKANSGFPIQNSNNFYDIYQHLYGKRTYLITGGCGFIGSHMVDKLINLGHNVIVIDNLLSGSLNNLASEATFEKVDIRNIEELKPIFEKYKFDGIFHFAAIARTPWCIDDPILCYQTNVIGTLNILECAKLYNIKRVVLSSSNVVYAFMTPYRSSKEAGEQLGIVYNKMYNMSVMSLRYSNVYGKRQSEEGPSPNVFAALRKSKKEKGKLLITGDGTQTRNYTHVLDIVEGNFLAMNSDYCGIVDLCTGIPVELNYAAKYFDCPIEYIDERPGDIKHIIQSPEDAYRILGWKAMVSLEDGIQDVL